MISEITIDTFGTVILAVFIFIVVVMFTFLIADSIYSRIKDTVIKHVFILWWPCTMGFGILFALVDAEKWLTILIPVFLYNNFCIFVWLIYEIVIKLFFNKYTNEIKKYKYLRRTKHGKRLELFPKSVEEIDVEEYRYCTYLDNKDMMVEIRLVCQYTEEMFREEINRISCINNIQEFENKLEFKAFCLPVDEKGRQECVAFNDRTNSILYSYDGEGVFKYEIYCILEDDDEDEYEEQQEEDGQVINKSKNSTFNLIIEGKYIVFKEYCASDINKHYIVVDSSSINVDRDELDYRYCDYYFSSIDGKYILSINNYRTDSKKDIECNVIADVEYIYGLDDLYAKDYIFSRYGYLLKYYMFNFHLILNYLEERGCNNEYYMKLLMLIGSIENVCLREYIEFITEENIQFVKDNIKFQELCVCLNNYLSLLDSNDNDKINEANKKLNCACKTFKKANEYRELVCKFMDWFSKEYSKSVINYKIKPTNEEDINFIENIFTHKHDNAVITMDSELKNNGFEGEFPIYYREKEKWIEYIIFNITGYDYKDVVLHKLKDTENFGYTTQTLLGICMKDDTYNYNDIKNNVYRCLFNGGLLYVGEMLLKDKAYKKQITKNNEYTQEQIFEMWDNLNVRKHKTIVESCMSILENGKLSKLSYTDFICTESPEYIIRSNKAAIFWIGFLVSIYLALFNEAFFIKTKWGAVIIIAAGIISSYVIKFIIRSYNRNNLKSIYKLKKE